MVDVREVDKLRHPKKLQKVYRAFDLANVTLRKRLVICANWYYLFHLIFLLVPLLANRLQTVFSTSQLLRATSVDRFS